MEIKIIRVGECRRCGFCCGYEKKQITEGACRHLTPDGSCGIYNKRDMYCPECGHDHKACIIGPILPTGNPDCGFRWIEQQSGALVKKIEFF